MVFSSPEVYSETRIYLRDHPAMLDQWESKYPGFISMRTAYNTLTDDQLNLIFRNASNKGFENILTLVWEEDRTFHIARNNPVDYLSTLANHQGLIQIGNKLLKHNRNEIIEVEDISKNIANELINIHDAESISDHLNAKVYSRNLSSYRMEEEANIIVRGGGNNLYGNVICKNQFSSNRRVYGEIGKQTDYDGVNPFDVIWGESRYQEKVFLGWKDKTVNRICIGPMAGRVIYEVISNGNDVPVFPNTPEVCINEVSSIIGRVLYESPLNTRIIDFGPPDLSVQHKMQHISGGVVTRTESCTTSADNAD